MVCAGGFISTQSRCYLRLVIEWVWSGRGVGTMEFGGVVFLYMDKVRRRPGYGAGEGFSLVVVDTWLQLVSELIDWPLLRKRED